MTNPLNTIEPRYRGIIYLIVTAVAVVAVFMGVKEVRSYIRRNKDKKNPQLVVNETQTEYNAQVSAGETLSKPASEYIAVANTIEKLLDGCESASSEVDVIRNIISVVKKPVDWSKLKIDFGVREISQCGSFGAVKDQYDLPTLLKDQLDTSGFYTIDIDGYKSTGFAFETLSILNDYFKTIGITI